MFRKLFHNSEKEKFTLRNRVSELKRNGTGLFIVGLVPLFFALAQIFLVFWGLNVSLSDCIAYLDNTHKILAQGAGLENYKFVFDRLEIQVLDPETGARMIGFWEMVFNSLWWTFGATFVMVGSTVCFAYAVARYNFWGRKLIYAFVVLKMMLPIYGQTAANYTFLSEIGFVNSPLFLLALGAGDGMHFLIFYSYFRNISNEYVEAAKLDGAGPAQIFIKIMLPLASPILTAIGLGTLISNYNDYTTTAVYLADWPTLASGLFKIQQMSFSMGLQTPQYFAAIFITALPVAVVFLVFNKQIMNNVTIGGLKG